MVKTIWDRSIRTIYKLFLVALAAVLFLGYQKPAYGPPVAVNEADRQCLVSAVWHEARGESAKGKRAVLEVVIHRAYRSGKTTCEVVSAPGQFPWFKKKGLVAVTEETLLHYNEAQAHGRVLKDEKFVYFNKHKTWGTDCVRIGAHKFCKERK